ncbi:MAG: alpha/beta hydrolase [Rhodospirillales bacterium]
MVHRFLAASLVVAVISTTNFLASAVGAEEVRLTAEDLVLTANLERAGKADLSGGVFLITHGTLAHAGMEIIAGLQKALADRGFASLAPTLSLGLSERKGMADCSTRQTHTHEDALDEIGLWVGWLKKQGADSLHLVGHSRGGNQTAWFVAERNDAAITTVSLIAPATWDEQKRADDFKNTHGFDLAPLLAKATAMVADGRGEDDLMTEDGKAAGLLYCPGAAVTARSFSGYYKADPRFHTPALLASLPVPVLVLIGSDDTTVTGLEAAVAPLARDGQVEAEVIDGADHFFRDFFIEDAADHIEAFITR